VRFPLSGGVSPRHLAAVRVPIPVVIFLVLAVAGGVWWGNTRHMDFVTPPSESKLAAIRVRIESSLPQTDQVDDAISVPVVAPPPPPVEPPKPVIELGDLTIPPSLQDYGVRSPAGSAHLIELATLLEEKEEFQRALLAWERVIDLTHPDEGQAANAISAIKRLRPTLPDWNAKPETAITLSLRAGTAKKSAKTLTPILEGVARDLERASSGIVKITTSVTASQISRTTKGPAPVAIWLAGPERTRGCVRRVSRRRSTCSRPTSTRACSGRCTRDGSQRSCAAAHRGESSPSLSMPAASPPSSAALNPASSTMRISEVPPGVRQSM